MGTIVGTILPRESSEHRRHQPNACAFCFEDFGRMPASPPSVGQVEIGDGYLNFNRGKSTI